MNGSNVRVRLAEGFEVIAKTVSIEYPEPAYSLTGFGNRVREYTQDAPVVIIELGDQELFRMVEFFGALANFVGKPKLTPAKPGIKRLIDLS